MAGIRQQPPEVKFSMMVVKHAPETWEGTQGNKLYRIVKDGPGIYTASIHYAASTGNHPITERMFGSRHQAFVWLSDRAAKEREAV